MKFRRKNRDDFLIANQSSSLEHATATRPPSDQATIATPNPLADVREKLSTRLQYLDNAIARFDQDKLTMQNEMESLKKQIFEIDRATLAMPILDKIAELYR